MEILDTSGFENIEVLFSTQARIAIAFWEMAFFFGMSTQNKRKERAKENLKYFWDGFESC